jgi:uncharacterized phage protein (TIGR02220 family)
MKGFIKDYRRELISDIWMMPPLYHRVWQYIKYTANHLDTEIPMRDGSKTLIKKGQHLHSIRGIAQGIGWYEGAKWIEPNPKTISSILTWLVKQQMISIERGKGNRQYTLITLLNWDLYQQKDIKGNSRETLDGEGSTQPLDINKNEEECFKNEKEIKPYVEIINYLNQKTGKKYSSKSESNKKLINGRFSEGRILEDFIHVIDIKCQQWLDNADMNKYLRPDTLFSSKNFEKYVNEKLQGKQPDPRNKDIEFSKWLAAGKDAESFNWED